MATATELEKVVRDYIPQVIHLSLGTCAGNKPWVCEVHFSYDDDLNLYFRSLKTTRHCQEIAKNPQVAGNIHMQHQLKEPPFGIYFEGTAKLLENVDETHPAYITNRSRLGTPHEILEQARSQGPHFYQITVSDFYVFGGVGAESIAKHHLPWNAKKTAM